METRGRRRPARQRKPGRGPGRGRSASGAASRRHRRGRRAPTRSLGGECAFPPSSFHFSAAAARSLLQPAAPRRCGGPDSRGRHRRGPPGLPQGERPIAHSAPSLVRDRLGVAAQAAATCGPRLAWIRGCRSGSISNFRGSISNMFGVRSSGRVLPAACVDPRPLWCARLPPPGAHRPSLSEAIIHGCTTFRTRRENLPLRASLVRRRPAANKCRNGSQQ